MQTAKAKLMQFCNLFSRKKHHGLQKDEARVTLEYCSSQQDTQTQKRQTKRKRQTFNYMYIRSQTEKKD